MKEGRGYQIVAENIEDGDEEDGTENAKEEEEVT